MYKHVIIIICNVMQTVGKYFVNFLKNPKQVSKKYYTLVSFLGRLGFFTKALIYGFIGVLTFQSATSDVIHNESPQGVFIFLGSQKHGAGQVYLTAMIAGVAVYVLWRLLEGLSGQGYDSKNSKKKNFFKYRVSPLVSALVYFMYGIYIVMLFLEPPAEVNQSVRDTDNSCFPTCWRDSIMGRIGLFLLALSFTIATITQLIPSLTGNFKDEMDPKKLQTTFGKIVKYPFYLTGHVGFLGRALLFFLVCFLFWKILFGYDIRLDPSQATVSQAVNSIRDYFWGKAIMGLMGFGLVVYAIFAFLCVYYKIFPTKTGRPTGGILLPRRHSNLQLEQV